MNTTTRAARKPADRQLRAYQQADNYIVFETVGSETDWTVLKVRNIRPGDPTDYQVNPTAGTCTCPDHVGRGNRCKHVHLVQLHIQAGADQQPRTISPELAAELIEERDTYDPRDEDDARFARIRGWMAVDFPDDGF